MCYMIIGAKGTASTLQEAVELGYMQAESIVYTGLQAKRPLDGSCFCGIDVPATLDACGNVWDFNGNDYIVHEQVTFLEAENE